MYIINYFEIILLIKNNYLATPPGQLKRTSCDYHAPVTWLLQNGDKQKTIIISLLWWLVQKNKRVRLHFRCSSLNKGFSDSIDASNQAAPL